MRRIPLSRGEFALVDDEDFDWLNVGNWWVEIGPNGNKYAIANHLGRRVQMHNLVKSPPKGMINDHRDTNSLNNQKSNLRTCTQSKNCMNRSRQPNRWGFKGVSFDRRYVSKPFIARLGQRGKSRWLGQFETPVLAAKAYNEAALKEYGEFANLNQL